MFESIHYNERTSQSITILLLHDIACNQAFFQINVAACRLIWLKEGQATITTKTNEYHINAGHTFFLWGNAFSIKATKGLNGFYVSICPELLNTLQTELYHSFLTLFQPQNSSPSALAMDEETVIDTEDILLKLRKELLSVSKPETEIAKGLLRIFLLYLSKKADQHNPLTRSREMIIMQEFFTLLGKNITSRKQVADYASALHITPGYLNQAIKKASGYTASHHIQQQIVSHAKKKAIYSDRSMKEIAYELGFDDTSHFSKFFKINSGINFTDFKRKQLSYS